MRAEHGYRVHMSMISFAWAPRSVDSKVKKLPRADRRQARAALNHLLSCRDSDYCAFYDRHLEFLHRHGKDADEKLRKRPLRFIEQEGCPASPRKPFVLIFPRPKHKRGLWSWVKSGCLPQSGLECALWPHLYWHRNLCETVARASHESRQGRKRKAKRQTVDPDSDDLESSLEAVAQNKPEKEVQGSKLGRIKRGFIRKVLSPLIGYGTDYELLHFVYDLSMWTTVGTKKNIARHTDVPLRVVLSGCPWTPQYWRIRHSAVIDMQRQCGSAALFRTRAPYEITFPYHEWVMHEQRTAGRARMHLAGAETLHQAHVLLELDKGFISGARGETGRPDRVWKNHLLGPMPPKEAQTVVSRVTRLEFQDGKRKSATKSYHGRGTTHSHSRDFHQNIKDIGLEKKLSAHLPNKERHPLLHGLVMDGQRDRTSSKLPVRSRPSKWDDKTGKVLLKHTEKDQDLHLRAYFPQTMEITKCHEDVQQSDGNGAVLRYVATYSLKFSDSMDKEWLNEQASDYSVARRILFSYHPLEPEMWLTLAQERFPQVSYKGTLVNFFVPLPDTEEDKKPKLLRNYEDAAWRGDDMPLIEFLRKSNESGGIIRHIKDKHFQDAAKMVEEAMLESEMPPKEAAKQSAELIHSYKRRCKAGEEVGTLVEFVAAEWDVWLPAIEEYANDYKSQAEKLVAASMYSMLNDRYYGQWLVLNKPFSRLSDLMEAYGGRADRRVPAHYRYFAMALEADPGFWTDDDQIREQMELEAYNRAMVDTILNKIKAQRSLVDRYLSGELDSGEDVQSGDDSTDGEPGRDCRKLKKVLTGSQEKLRASMKPFMERALRAAQARDDDEQEELLAEALQQNKMLFASGGPGSGKTFILHDQIRRWQGKGARILFVLPTGQLAANMKAQHPHIDVDTYHGGLLFHRELSETLGIMTQYDLIILDEARGKLSKRQRNIT